MGTPTVLSEEEVDRYRRDGFLVPEFRLPDEAIERLLAATGKLIATTSVWIAVTESTIDNGCLRFIPGSHRTDDPGLHDSTPRPNEMFSGSLDPTSFEESTAVDIELQPGQFAMFDVYTIHGSQPNSGTQARAGFTCRYMPGTSVYHHDRAEVRDQPGYGHESRGGGGGIRTESNESRT